MLMEVLAWGLLVAQLAFFAYYFFNLYRRGSRFQCPKCQAWLDRGLIRWEGVRCSACDWSLRYVARPSPPQTNRPASVLSFQEAMPHNKWLYFRYNFCAFLIVVNVVFGGVAALIALQEESFTHFLTGLFVFNSLGVPLSAIFAYATSAAFEQARPAVEVRGTKLRIRGGHSWTEDYELSDCAWFVGPLSRYSIQNQFLPLCQQQVILLALPRNSRDEAWYVPIGFTAESRDHWKEVLKKNRVVRWKTQEQPLSSVARIVNAVVTIMCVPLFFASGFVLVWSVPPVLEALGLSQGLAAMLTMVSWLPGMLFLAAYAAFFWPFRRRRRIPTTRSKTERRKTFRIFFSTVLLVASLQFALPIWFTNLRGMPLTDMERYVVISYLTTMVLVCGYDLARRLSTTELESVESLTRAREPGRTDSP